MFLGSCIAPIFNPALVEAERKYSINIINPIIWLRVVRQTKGWHGLSSRTKAVGLQSRDPLKTLLDPGSSCCALVREDRPCQPLVWCTTHLLIEIILDSIDAQSSYLRQLRQPGCLVYVQGVCYSTSDFVNTMYCAPLFRF